MADQNYLYAQRNQSPFQSFIQGFGAGQGIIGNTNKQQYLAAEAQKDQLLSAIKLHDEMKGMAFDNLEFYNNTYRPALAKLGVPAAMLPEYKDVGELNKGLFRNEQIKAQMKARMEGPKVIPAGGAVYEGGNFLYPEVSPTTNAMLGQRKVEEEGKWNRQQQNYQQNVAIKNLDFSQKSALLDKRASTAPKEWKPEPVELEDGSMGVLDLRTGTVRTVTGAVGKAKAGATFEKQKFASSQAAKDLAEANIKPDDKEYDELYKKQRDKYMTEIGGGGKAAAPPETKKTGYRGPGYYYDKSGQKVPIRSETEYQGLMGK